MENYRNALNIFVGNREVGYFEDPLVDGAMLQWLLGIDDCICVCVCGLDSLGCRQETAAGCCLHVNENYFDMLV